MNPIKIDPLSWIPDSIKQQILDNTVDFIAEQAKKMLGEKFSDAIKKLKSDAAFKKAFNESLKRATERFSQEYIDKDEDLVVAIIENPDFWEAKSVRNSLLQMIKNPGKWAIHDKEILLNHFDDALPYRRNRERVDMAVTFFLQCLTEELWHLPELMPIYQLQLQKVTAEKASEMVNEIKGMRQDVRSALVAFINSIAKQQRLLNSSSHLALPNIETQKVLHNLPQPDYVHFVGRQKELDHLRKLLHPEDRIWSIVIDGIGGIGKTALALEVARRYLDKFDELPEEERFGAIIWTSAKAANLTADGIVPRQQVTSTINDIYKTIAVTLEKDNITRDNFEDQSRLIHRALTRQRTLLIVDNLETIDDERINAFIRELPNPTKCIITTRQRIDIADPIRLSAMPRDDTLSLIAQECEKKDVQLSEEQAELLYKRTGGVPLAVIWSVAQMGYGYSAKVSSQ